jgi:hypothetical protein
MLWFLMIAGKVDNDGRLVFAELAGRVGWLKPNGECNTQPSKGLSAGTSV